jgi:hypothetical protein
MARSCPACGRPNADTATKCLYCVAALPPLEEALAGSFSSPAPVESPTRHLLFLLGSGTSDEARVAELSRIARISAYDSRQSLSAPRPRIFRRFETEAEARRFSGELIAARIAHYVVAESTVLSLPIARAVSFDLGDARFAIELDPAYGRVAPSGYEELLLLVRGEITRERLDETKLGSRNAASRRLSPGLRLHVYTRKATVAVEIDPESFDFGVLGAEKTSSAFLNLERLVARIQEKATSVTVDRGFDFEPLLLSRSGGTDPLEALASSERGRTGVAYDDEVNFRFYARWRYRLERYMTALRAG